MGSLELAFIKSMYLCRELGAGITRFGMYDTVDKLRRIQQGTDEARAQLLGTHHGLTCSDSVAEVARLVLKDFDIHEHDFCGREPTESGKLALKYVHEVVFGAEGDDANNFMQSVFMGTVYEATLAQNMCTAALIGDLSPKNSLSLYALASTCGCKQLLDAAETMALNNFTTAALEDPTGLAALPDQVLMHLLTQDELRVECELDVFKALASWVEHDLPNRVANFARRMAKVVRLSQLTIEDMTFMMDQHPLVSYDTEAIEIVTFAILQIYSNTNFENGMGRSTNNKPRLCQRGNTQAASQPPTNRPSFEATLRALSSAPSHQAVAPQKAPLQSPLGNYNSMGGVALEMMVSPGKKLEDQRRGKRPAACGENSPVIPSRKKICW